MSDSPFIPGARCCISYRGERDHREVFVEKVYKNGNFTLRGSKQQWRPWDSSYGGWSASETGRGGRFSYHSIKPWNDETDKEISELMSVQRRRDLIHKIREKVSRLEPRWLTEAALINALALLTPPAPPTE